MKAKKRKMKAKKRKMNENKEIEEAEKKKKKIREEQIKEFLVCHFEMKLFEPDKLNSRRKKDFCIKKVDDAFPISSTCFPSIMKIHTTGSRAEKLWISNSDTDIIYEIGPGLVYQNDRVEKTKEDQNKKHQELLIESKSTSGTKYFFWEETEHVGHYRIYDSKGGGYLYPKDLQMKLAPTFKYLQDDETNNNENKSKTNQAAVTFDNNKKNVKRNDHVIGLKLDKWPDSIKDQLILKLGVNVAEQLLGKK